MLCTLCLEREAIDAEGLCRECIDAELEAGDKRIIAREEEEKNTPPAVPAPKKKPEIWGGGDV